MKIMLFMKIFLKKLIWISAFFLCSTLQAEKDVPKSYGISMHGTCRYPSTFTHFKRLNPHAPKGGTLRLGIVAPAFTTLNPFLVGVTCAPGMGLYSHLPFDQLMMRSFEEPFAVYGRLAQSVQLPKDRSWMTFYLRKNAKFHNGDPVTAEDVLFTYQMLSKHGGPARKLLGTKVSNVTIIDPHTIKFDFKKLEDGKHDLELPMVIAMLPVFSKKSLEGKKFTDTGMTPLIGSGPYKITNVIPGKSITFTRDPMYWGKDLPVVQGLYNADITYECFYNEMAAFEAFKKGLIDCWVETNGQRWEKGYDFPAIREGKIERIKVEHRHVVGMEGLVFNIRLPIFKNIRVRKALSLLFDAQECKKNMGTWVKQIESFFQNMEFAATPSVSEEEQKFIQLLPSASSIGPLEFIQSIPKLKRKKEAFELLKQAGWELRRNQWVNKITGKPFVFEILIQDRKNEGICLCLKQQLEKSGIFVNLKRVESSHYAQRLMNFDFDTIIHKWGHSASPGIEQKVYWHSFFADKPSRNYIGLKSPDIDFTCEKALQATTRKELVTSIKVLDRLLRQGYYVIPLFYDSIDRYAFWKHVGHPPVESLSDLTPEIYSFWVKPDEKTNTK